MNESGTCRNTELIVLLNGTESSTFDKASTSFTNRGISATRDTLCLRSQVRLIPSYTPSWHIVVRVKGSILDESNLRPKS